MLISIISKKTLKYTIAYCCIFIFILITTTNTFCAGNKYGYDVVTLEKDRYTRTWESVNIKSNLDFSMPSSPIVSFDVSENNKIAFATTEKEIFVLDETQNVLNCFSFDVSGDYFIRWQGENIVLFLVRGDLAIEFGLSGECVSISKISPAKSNNSIWTEMYKYNSVNIGENTYEISKDMGNFLNFFTGNKYTILTKTDAYGNILMIYNVNDRYKNLCMLYAGAIVVFVCAIATIFIYGFVSYRKKAMNTGN